MEALIFELKTKTLSYKKSTNILKPVDNEILIKVAYSGICGTDLHILEGEFPCNEAAPFTLGHEFVGTVQAIGPQVKTFKIGDRVAVDPNSGCNLCKCCHTGIYHHCSTGGINNTIGIFRNGGWSSHAVVPESQVYLLPDDVEMSLAALSEPLSCLAHGWDIVNPLKVGANVLVSGAGIIGLLWASVLHLHGLRKTVTMSEPQERRREIFQKMNLDYKVKSPAELTDTDCFCIAIDCSGSGPAMETAVKHLAPGGRLCIFGCASPKAKICIEPFQVYKKELKIMGVNINPYTFSQGISLVQAMGTKYLSFEKLGIKTFKLSEYREAMAALKSGEISKAIFKF